MIAEPLVDVVTFTGFHVQFSVKDVDVTDILSQDETGILEIRKGDKRLFYRGDMIYVRESGWYQLNRIDLMRQDKGVRKYRGLMMERSDTSLLVLPVFGGTRHDVSFTDHLLNAYLHREDHEDGSIWILMKRPYNPNSQYENAIHFFESSDYFVKKETLGDQFEMITMDVPEPFETELILIKQGKFSEIGNFHKQRIYEFHNIRDKYNKMRLELEKSEVLREKMENEYDIQIPEGSELRSRINDDRETFYNKLIINEHSKGIE